MHEFKLVQGALCIKLNMLFLVYDGLHLPLDLSSISLATFQMNICLSGMSSRAFQYKPKWRILLIHECSSSTSFLMLTHDKVLELGTPPCSGANFLPDS